MNLYLIDTDKMKKQLYSVIEEGLLSQPICHSDIINIITLDGSRYFHDNLRFRLTNSIEPSPSSPK